MTGKATGKTKMEKIHLTLCGVFGACVIAAIVFIQLEPKNWFHLAGLGISSFVLALVCMDLMTNKAQQRLRAGVKEIKNEIKSLEQNVKKNSKEIARLKEELEKLPLADRIASIFPEPVGVLDRHEIRRALVISLTIVYILLLFKGEPIAEHFTWVYLSIIAFYFGSRGVEKYAEIRSKSDKGS